VNGELRSRLNSLADRLRSEDESLEAELIPTVALELEAWRAISPANIIKSWRPLLGDEIVNQLLDDQGAAVAAADGAPNLP
jgi:hypothetical protein